MTTRPFDPHIHCTVFQVAHDTPQERKDRWRKVRKWTRDSTVPTDPPSWLKPGSPGKHRISIHVVHEGKAQGVKRWNKAIGFAIKGKFPIDLPEWLQVRIDGMLLNHGGNGGP